MNDNIWAKGALFRSPKPMDYAGLSREQASRRAQAICAVAGETGQTIRAFEHLEKLMPLLALKAA